MSLYNLLFGRNPQTALLLAVIGLRENDVERLRDVYAEPDGSKITVYTRTGGGNRDDYPNLQLRKAEGWVGSVDDDFDSTYCTDTFAIPVEWQADVSALSDVLTHGMRPEFARHLSKTLRREPTESDKSAAAYASEVAALSSVRGYKANGHTFVPFDDNAMKKALELAEANNGQLGSCWGILPLVLDIKRNHRPYPNAPSPDLSMHLVRAEIDVSLKWEIDTEYWQHCVARWSNEFPKAIAQIQQRIDATNSRNAAA
jgi:hypothetical protein